MCRHAALMAVSAVGEGCQKYMEESLPLIVNAVLHFINDPVNSVALYIKRGLCESSLWLEAVVDLQ